MDVGSDDNVDVGSGEYDKDFDVKTCMEAEASPDEADAILEASITDFVAGDAVGKLMAFISQIRASSEVTRNYLSELCRSNNCPMWEIKLWVHTRWGSLSDCFRVVLRMQRVRVYFIRQCSNLIVFTGYRYILCSCRRQSRYSATYEGQKME